MSPVVTFLAALYCALRMAIEMQADTAIFAWTEDTWPKL